MSDSFATLRNFYEASRFSEPVDVIENICRSKDNTFKYKLSKGYLKMKNGHVSIYTKRLTKKVTRCNLCFKHIRVYKVDENEVLFNDSKRCRIVIDPVGNKLTIRFQTIDSALYLTRIIDECFKKFIKQYEMINVDVLVINEASDILEGKFEVAINGAANGKDMKKIVENRFQTPRLLTTRCSLEIQCGFNIIPVIDTMPISFLNEYFVKKQKTMFCSPKCITAPCPPSRNITLVILNQANEERKNYDKTKQCKRNNNGIEMPYNIDERWRCDLLPTWILRLMADLYCYGPSVEGIFRTSVIHHDLNRFYQHMLLKEDFIINRSTSFKACVLKNFLGKIDGGLLSSVTETDIDILLEGVDTSDNFIANRVMVEKLLNMVKSIPKHRLIFLQHLLVVFKAISDSKATKMDAHNIAICISPSIFQHITLSTISSIEKWTHLCVVLGCMITLIDRIIDKKTYKSIVDTFTRYKSIQSAESSLMSTASDSSMAAITKLRRNTCDELYISMTEDDNSNDENDAIIEADDSEKNDFWAELNDNETSEEKPESGCDDVKMETSGISRSRVCMGSIIYDKLNSSQQSNIENVDPLITSPLKCRHLMSLEDSPERVQSTIISQHPGLDTSAICERILSPVLLTAVDEACPKQFESVMESSTSSSQNPSTRHVSLMGSRVTPFPRQRRKYSNTSTINLRHSNSRSKNGTGNTDSVTNERSRSPHVKSLVSKYEKMAETSGRVLRSSSKTAEYRKHFAQ